MPLTNRMPAERVSARSGLIALSTRIADMMDAFEMILLSTMSSHDVTTIAASIWFVRRFMYSTKVKANALTKISIVKMIVNPRLDQYRAWPRGESLVTCGPSSAMATQLSRMSSSMA